MHNESRSCFLRSGKNQDYVRGLKVFAVHTTPVLIANRVQGLASEGCQGASGVMCLRPNISLKIEALQEKRGKNENGSRTLCAVQWAYTL